MASRDGGRPIVGVVGGQAVNIPFEPHQIVAERAGASEPHELLRASHTISVSLPDDAADTVLEALDLLRCT